MTDCYKMLVVALEKHYQSSDIADQVLLPMIVAPGTDLLLLLPFLESYSSRKKLPLKILDQVIAASAKQQSFPLLLFCVNNLIFTRPLDSYRQFNQNNIAELLKVLGFVADVIKNRNFLSKVETVAQNSAYKRF